MLTRRPSPFLTAAAAAAFGTARPARRRGLSVPAPEFLPQAVG